jgi:hypothetical protein
MRDILVSSFIEIKNPEGSTKPMSSVGKTLATKEVVGRATEKAVLASECPCGLRIPVV